MGPTRQDKELVYFEFRRRTQKGGFNRQGMAFEPRITHDFEKDESALDVPIFLFKNADDQLTAGLRVGWTDEEDEWGLAIFVGSRFTYPKLRNPGQVLSDVVPANQRRC